VKLDIEEKTPLLEQWRDVPPMQGHAAGAAEEDAHLGARVGSL
jgi:hypothetical protein